MCFFFLKKMLLFIWEGVEAREHKQGETQSPVEQGVPHWAWSQNPEIPTKADASPAEPPRRRMDNRCLVWNVFESPQLAICHERLLRLRTDLHDE